MEKGAWTRTPDDVAAAFHAALPADPRVERRKMFGYPCAFVGGNMFSGTFASTIVVRLPEAERAVAMNNGGAVFAPMAGRPMKEYVVVPPSIATDPAGLSEWVGQAFDFALMLPPKEPGRKKAAPKPGRAQEDAGGVTSR